MGAGANDGGHRDVVARSGPEQPVGQRQPGPAHQSERHLRLARRQLGRGGLGRQPGAIATSTLAHSVLFGAIRSYQILV